MNKYEKIKLIVLCFAAAIFSVLLYLNSLNGRYVHIIDSKMILDTRTGDILTLKGKKKIN